MKKNFGYKLGYVLGISAIVGIVYIIVKLVKLVLNHTQESMMIIIILLLIEIILNVKDN